MRQTMRNAGPALAACLGLAFAACGTGPGTGDVQVVLAGGPEPAGAAVSWSVVAQGDVPLEAIGSASFPIERIDLKPESQADEAEGEDSEGEDAEGGADEAGWISVSVPEGTTVELVGLAEEEDDETVATGTVPATTYRMVRLVCAAGATLVLDADVTLPGGEVIAAGSYPLQIPSCESSGLKIIGGFSVPEGETATVVIELDFETTVQNLLRDGNGFKLAPVLRLR